MIVTSTLTRATAVAMAATGLAAGVVVALAVTAPAPGRAASSFPDLLTLLAAGALAGCAVWAWVSVLAVLAEAVSGRVGRVRGVPTAVRRVVLVLCGLTALSALAAPAGAADPRPDGGASLAGLPFPDRADGPAAAPHTPRRPGPPSAGTHTVRAGDSLWSIARTRRPAADDAALARDVARLAAANRAVVADPDLIRPGQRLVTPPAPR